MEPTPRQDNIPARLTSFVGRAEDLKGVGERLRTSRVISIVGPGGAGKSRLAMEAAADLIDDFPDGVWVAELHTATSENDIYALIARALEVPGVPGMASASLVRSHLRDLEALVILDNCEHLIDELAAIVQALTASCPKLRFLATSRERIRTTGEMVWLLEGLEVPSMEIDLEDEWVDSVELFRQRAQAVDPHFEVTSKTRLAVQDICLRLDGLPLAIELAAARLDMFSVGDVADQLDDIGGFLTSTLRDVDDRHSSLQDVMGWSYGLLSPGEQDLFDRLGVFSGGFDLDSARHVAGFDLSQDEFDAGFASLLSKSLISRVTGVPESRYRLLEGLRQFAVALLGTKGRLRECMDRHARYFRDVAARAEPYLWSGEQVDWLERLETDLDNLRQALDRLLARDRTEDAQLMAGSLARFWDLRGHYAEGLDWLRRSIRLGEASDAEITVLVANGLATLAVLNGEIEISIAACEMALAAAEEVDDVAGKAYATQYLGLGCIYAEELDRAREILEESVGAARESGSAMLSGWSSIFLAGLELTTGDVGAGRSHYLQARAWLEGDDDAEAIGWTYVAEGIDGWRSDDHTKATTALQMAMTRFAPIHAAWGISIAGVTAGRVLLERGDNLEALHVLLFSEKLRAAIGAVHLPGVAAWSDEGLEMAGVEVGARDLEEVETEVGLVPFEKIPSLLHAAIDDLAREVRSRPVAPARRVDLEVVLRREGGLWELVTGAGTFHIPHVVGLSHLAVLLASPGREVAAVELGGDGALSSGGDGAILDRRAIDQLKERLLALDEEISQASAREDRGRQSAAQAEFDEITSYLSSTLGMDGQSRDFTSPAERARVKVTKGIRLAIDKITEVAPDLGLHLETSISTGRFCFYRPDPSSNLRWVVIP